MSVLGSHLDQMSVCCQGIDSLPFPPPKIFTAALLSSHDITSLIRDTESHERALFSVPPPPPPPTSLPKAKTDDEPSSKRRRTVFNVAQGEVTTGPPNANRRKHTAVAAVLGGEMTESLQRGKSEVDVEVLLKGAEKLCSVYEMPGARDRINELRGRYRAGKGTLGYYEGRVAEQAAQLAEYKHDWMDDDEEEEQGADNDVWTEDDLRREEEEARELEGKKRELQRRLKTMEKDLGGLMSI
ncbi:DASH complex subunit Spc34 [Emericellopsis atlantica]|uniref:DASH complex subunit SPC34 n=1 Tax=Emericellopsis atlantica TaxID=2614577 RepID=A0A9P7ZGB1_9HYPO|nr:DASH complex subunit Spc34 [Emericellopsis atlantica]KAG9251132.1 DASH complex subunit Spc34 [Emericellopsis atlantica]